MTKEEMQSLWKSLDELPTRYKPVIVAYKVQTIDGSIEYNTTQAFLNASGGWIADNYNGQNEKITQKVVAWMPILTYDPKNNI